MAALSVGADTNGSRRYTKIAKKRIGTSTREFTSRAWGVCADGLSWALWKERKQICARVVVKLMSLLAYWKPEQLSLHSLHLLRPGNC